MRVTGVCVLWLVLAVSCGCGAGAAHAGPVASSAQTWGQTPSGAVRGAAQALDTADAALLDQLVDVEGLIGQAVDIFLDDAATPQGQASLPPVLGMILSSVGSSAQARSSVRSLLQSEAGEFVRYGVRSGNFAGKPRDVAPPSGMLAPLFADASLGRKEIRNVGDAVQDGETTWVPFSVYDHGNGNTYAVQGVLRRDGGLWRVVGIRNVRELMTKIRGEATE